MICIKDMLKITVIEMKQMLTKLSPFYKVTIKNVDSIIILLVFSNLLFTNYNSIGNALKLYIVLYNKNFVFKII